MHGRDGPGRHWALSELNVGRNNSLLGQNLVILFLSLALLTAPPGETPDFTFFEAKIRPVLVSKCYGCHSSKLAAPKGELNLDTRDGLLKGGATGSAIVPGKSDESRLLKALRYDDPETQMRSV